MKAGRGREAGDPKERLSCGLAVEEAPSHSEKGKLVSHTYPLHDPLLTCF